MEVVLPTSIKNENKLLFIFTFCYRIKKLNPSTTALVTTIITPAILDNVFSGALLAITEAILAQMRVNIIQQMRQSISGIPPM